MAALVCIDGTEIPYRRAGHGPPVLLLPGENARRGADALLEALAQEFRVILPDGAPGDTGGEPPAPAEDAVRWSAWLRGIIDGLGLDRPVVVVDASLAGAVEPLARHDPDRIRSVLPWPTPVAVPGKNGTATLRAAVRGAMVAGRND